MVLLIYDSYRYLTQKHKRTFMQKKIFITDFDGVLCDSVMECLLVSHNAYHQLQQPGTERLLDLDRIPQEQQREFRRLRAYLKGAEDFVPMYASMQYGRAIASQQNFDAWRETLKDQLPDYTRAFYTERDYLIRHERELWLHINPLFDRFAQILRERSSFENLQILTTKRREDVLEVFNYQQIPFPAEQVTYIKAAGKSQKLLDILREQDADFEKSVYFEDQVDFLVESQKHGIGSYLADWGYVSDEQRNLAKQNNIPIISTQQYIEILSAY